MDRYKLLQDEEIEFIDAACPKDDLSLSLQFCKISRKGSISISSELPKCGVHLRGPTTKCVPRNKFLLDEVNGVSTYCLTHLPPLLMNFDLPSCYPGSSSHPTAPVISVESCWLPKSILTRIRCDLDAIISRHPGELILWSLVEFLRFESVAILFPCATGILSLDLFKFFDLYTSLPCSIIQCKDLLVSHNDDCLDRDFSLTSHECPVCLETKPGSSIFRFSRCGCRVCRDCVRGAFTCAIDDGLMNQRLSCLLCLAEASLFEARLVLPRDVYDRYETLLLTGCLNRMPDVAYCPRQGCNNNPVILDNEYLGWCVTCETAFCPRCRSPAHGMLECPPIPMQSEKVVLTKQEKDDAASLRFLRNKCKPCPGCTATIEKTSGCNSMFCSHCHTFFCWACLRQMDGDYRHFVNDSCVGALFLDDKSHAPNTSL